MKNRFLRFSLVEIFLVSRVHWKSAKKHIIFVFSLLTQPSACQAEKNSWKLVYVLLRPKLVEIFIWCFTVSVHGWIVFQTSHTNIYL